MKVIYWGTYDTGKPRNRIMIRGLRENNVKVTEVRKDLWEGVEDKSQVKGVLKKVQILFYWFSCYPKLIIRYLKAPDHDCIIVGYLGHVDVLVLWPFAKIRKKKIIWDAFISLYDTVVSDRQLITRRNPISYLIFLFEKLVCKAANLVVLDTEAHADYFRTLFSLSQSKCVSVPVGVEIEKFPVSNKLTNNCNNQNLRVTKILFYGQFIPLHGIETIIHAAQILNERDDASWTLIGTGQERKKIEELLSQSPVRNMRWLTWVDYEELQVYIKESDICLGIFGTSGKASRVIPNKVYQIVSCGKACITRDSPAIRELFSGDEKGLRLVKAGNAEDLANAINHLISRISEDGNDHYFIEKRGLISPMGVGAQFVRHLQEAI